MEQALPLHKPNNNPEQSLEKQEITPEQFLQQLKKERSFRILDEKTNKEEEINFVEITPIVQISPDYVIYIGGFGTNVFAYDQQLYELAKRGRKVIYINPLKGMSVDENLETYMQSNTSLQSTTPKLLQEKASMVLRLIREKHISHCDIVGHSQGGAVATLVTASIPKTVGQLVLDTPAGLVGKKSRMELIMRSVQECASEYEYAKKKAEEGDLSYMDEWKKQSAKSNITDPSHFVWRLKDEIATIGQTDITPLLKNIQKDKQTSPGPTVVLLTANNDKIFKAEEIEKSLGETEQVLSYINNWAMYIDKNAGHGFITKNDPRLSSIFMENIKTKAPISSNHALIADVVAPQVRKATKLLTRNKIAEN